MIDPVTGDFLFSTFGGGSRVLVVRGFRPPPPQLPPPVAGKNVNAFTARGTVRIRRPGGKVRHARPGQQIPVGTTVDTLKGRVTLVAAGNQTATFYAGVFRLGAGQGRHAADHAHARRAAPLRPRQARDAAAKRKKKRRLWGDGKGRFRTKGEYSSATVRGTKWLVEDRCTKHAHEGHERSGRRA